MPARPYPRPHPDQRDRRRSRVPAVAQESRTNVPDRRRQARGRGQELRRGRRRRPHQPRGPGRRVLHPARAVRLRQDHDPADDRRVRGADLRPHRAQGPGRDLAAALQAQRQHGLPELRAVPAPDHLRERRVRAAPQGRQGCGGQDPRHRHAGARRAARLRASQADPDLGRPGAARRARPGAHQQAGRAAARRAARAPST